MNNIYNFKMTHKAGVSAITTVSAAVTSTSESQGLAVSFDNVSQGTMSFPEMGRGSMSSSCDSLGAVFPRSDALGAVSSLESQGSPASSDVSQGTEHFSGVSQGAISSPHERLEAVPSSPMSQGATTEVRIPR